MDSFKEIFIHTHEHSLGYIIDGFPCNQRQAKLFEKTFYKVSIIVYTTLVLDALLARMITQHGSIDINEVRVDHIQSTKQLNKVYKKYEHQTIKIHANYPPEDTCTHLVENLEDFWGYKFIRLYNKNQ